MLRTCRYSDNAAEEALVVVLRKHTRLVDCDEEIPALREQLLDTIPCLLIDDQIMKAFVNLPVVGHPPKVDRVRQDLAPARHSSAAPRADQA